MPDLATTATLLTSAAQAATSTPVAGSVAAAGAAGSYGLERMISFAGMFVLIGIAFICSRQRRAINYRVVVWGLLLQIIFGVLVLGIPVLGFRGPLAGLFVAFNDVFNALMGFTAAGAQFVFSSLADGDAPSGFIFATQVLPSIIFFSSLMSVLYYLGVMQKIVLFFAWIMQKSMGTSGAETLSTAANIFVGQTEAPLVVRPYVARMTTSELFLVMVGGMANTAGSLMAAYVMMLKDFNPDIAGHLMTATIMSAPAAVAISKIMIPETEVPETLGTVHIKQEECGDANAIEAAARGASDGLSLALNVGAMLIAFIALIAMLNALLNLAGGWIHFEEWGGRWVASSLWVGGKPVLSLETIFSWLFAPLAFVMGVPWKDAGLIGALLGQKVVLNEFVAYMNMAKIGAELSPRSLIIASYALSGFANFSSIAIQIGGIGGMAPNRRSDLARLGMRAIIGGSLASFLTATIAGFLI